MNIYEVANRLANRAKAEDIEITADVIMQTQIKTTGNVNDLNATLYFDTTDNDIIYLATLKKIRLFSVIRSDIISSDQISVSLFTEEQLITNHDLQKLFTIEFKKIPSTIDAIVTTKLNICSGNDSKSITIRFDFDTEEKSIDYFARLEKYHTKNKQKLAISFNDIIKLFQLHPDKDEWIETSHGTFC